MAEFIALGKTETDSPHRTVTAHADVFSSLPDDLEPVVSPFVQLDLSELGVAPGGLAHILYHHSFGTVVEYQRTTDGRLTLTDRTVEALRRRGAEIEEVEDFVESVSGQFFSRAEDQKSPPIRVGGQPQWIQSPAPPPGADFIAQVRAFDLGAIGMTFFLFYDPSRDTFVQIDQMT